MRKIVRPKKVCELFGGISRVTLWRYTKDPDFPKKVKLGGPDSRATGFFEDEIQARLEALPRVDVSA